MEATNSFPESPAVVVGQLHRRVSQSGPIYAFRSNNLCHRRTPKTEHTQHQSPSFNSPRTCASTDLLKETPDQCCKSSRTNWSYNICELYGSLLGRPLTTWLSCGKRSKAHTLTTCGKCCESSSDNASSTYISNPKNSKPIWPLKWPPHWSETWITGKSSGSRRLTELWCTFELRRIFLRTRGHKLPQVHHLNSTCEKVWSPSRPTTFSNSICPFHDGTNESSQNPI